MIEFWLAVGTISSVVLLLMIWPVLQAKSNTDKQRIELNKQVYFDRLDELRRERDAGQISDEHFVALETELEKTLVRDASLEQSRSSSAHLSTLTSKPLLILSLLIVPVVAALTYLFLFDNYTQSSEWESLQQSAQFESVEEELAWMQTLSNRDLVLHLRTRVLRDPDDANGWMAYGQTLAQLRLPGEAQKAVEKALEINPSSLDYRLAYARLLTGSDDPAKWALAERQVNWVLSQQAENQTAQTVLGFIKYRQQDFQGAIDIWSRLLASREAAGLEEGQGAAMIRQQIENAKLELAQLEHLSKAKFSLPLTIKLSDQLARSIRPDTTVFLAVRGDDGSPAPVAVKRLKVADLPISMTLTDKDAMIPGRTMSNMSELSLVARISFSGNPTPRAGDYQSETLTWSVSESDDNGVAQLVIYKKI